jgi:hypothetical protein
LSPGDVTKISLKLVAFLRPGAVRHVGQPLLAHVGSGGFVGG